MKNSIRPKFNKTAEHNKGRNFENNNTLTKVHNNCCCLLFVVYDKFNSIYETIQN